jgi:molybdopterin-guanine dinucleotide biosynthesis protein MobB
VIHELRGAPEPSLDALLARMTPVDLVIVEGFKRFPHPKLEVHRRERGTPLLASEDVSIIALATDIAFPNVNLPQFGLDDIPTIAAFMLARLGIAAPA